MNNMGYDPHIIDVFKKEAYTCITNMNNLLLSVEKKGGSVEIYKEIKGDAHTLKGDSRMLGFDNISNAVHKLEDLFGEFENEKKTYDQSLFKNIFKLLDQIENAVSKVPDEIIEIDADAYLQAGPEDSGKEKTETMEKEKKSDTDVKTTVERRIKKDETKEIYKEQESSILNISLDRIENIIRISSVFPRYFNRFGYILAKFGTVREEIAENYPENTGLLNSIDSIVREFSHELAFYDLSAKQFQNEIINLKLVPLASVFDLFPRLVRDVADNTKKEINFIMEGRDVELDKGVVEKLKSILIHMIQNAVDHGIEPPSAREENGKPRQGRIVLKAFNKGDNVIIELSDDGFGLDVEKIKAKAIEKGLLSKEKAKDAFEAEIIPIIFEPGFSTKEVSKYSGRGIGMDVVANTVKELNGEITVKTLKNKGTSFTISLPLISSYISVTVFSVCDSLYGIPSSYIRSVLRIRDDQAIDAGKQWKVMNFEDMEISLIDLKIFFSLGESFSDQSKNVIVAIHQDEITGLIADEMVLEKKMLIRKVSGMQAKYKVIIGAVLMGKEKAIPVLNIPELFRFLKNGKGGVTRVKKSDDISKELGVKKILLVENSLVTRNLEKKILAGQDIYVFEAANGKEAIIILEKQAIDLVITDIEMPVMNGVELISYMKSKGQLRAIPVVVVSSYKNYKDKVSDMGVDFFIDKSNFSEEVLLDVLKKAKII